MKVLRRVIAGVCLVLLAHSLAIALRWGDPTKAAMAARTSNTNNNVHQRHHTVAAVVGSVLQDVVLSDKNEASLSVLDQSTKEKANRVAGHNQISDLTRKGQPVLSSNNSTFTNIMLVHVGKAGGETVKSILYTGCHVMRNEKRRLDCLAHLPSSQLSTAVQSYFHCFTVKPPKKKRNNKGPGDAYLFTVRHPVDRIASWYRYIHPNHCQQSSNTVVSPSCIAAKQRTNDPAGFVVQFFDTCFPTVQDWAFAGAAAAASPSGEDEINNKRFNVSSLQCQELAQSTLAGQVDPKQVPLAAHLVANFRHYMQTTVDANPVVPVLVIRMEHLWYDIKALDVLLNGTGDFGTKEGSAFTHGSERYNNNDTTTSSSTAAAEKLPIPVRSALCCVLTDEIERYRRLLELAVNLHVHEKQQSIADAVQNCGYESWEAMMLRCSIQAPVNPT